MLSILLVQHALAPGISEANMRSRLPSNMGDNPPNSAGSRPYLKITGALALRFSAIPTLPDLTPAASTPSVTVAHTAEALAPVLSTPPVGIRAAQLPDPATTQPAPVIANPPPAILPDDTRPTARPEDFLPFFQFPGGNGDVTIIMPATAAQPPAPGQLPPSSATYQQR